MADLYLICGAPGSGKSTYLKKYASEGAKKIVSRDEIRFSLVQEGESYFSHETKVLKEFYKRINESLAAGYDTYVDQTSLTPQSRRKVLRNVHGFDKIHAIWVKTSLKTCLERNELRAGTRAYVPPHVIESMYKSFCSPSFGEGFSTISVFSEDGKLTTKKN